MGVTLKIEALVFNLCQKLGKENFIECDYQNRIVKIEVNVYYIYYEYILYNFIFSWIYFV